MKLSIPEKMRAVQVDTATGKLISRIVPVPLPAKGEVLVKMAAAPINPSDIAKIKNTTDVEELAILVPGIEGSGRVVAAGKGMLPSLFMGKRVGCSAAFPMSGTYSEYLLTKASLCFPLPSAICDEQGSMLLVNPMTAFAFFDIAKRKRHRAIISTAAAGALGRMIDYLGNKYGIPVVNIVRKKEQETLLKGQQSEYVLCSSDEDFATKLKELAARLNTTLVLDAIGGKETSILLESLPYGGSLILYGSLSGEQPEINYREMVSQNKTITGFYLVNWSKDNGIAKIALNIMRVRRMLKTSISIKVQARFPLEQAQEAMDAYLGDMTAGKVLLVP